MEPDPRLQFYLAVAWRVVRDPGDGCRGARHHYGRMGGHLWGTGTIKPGPRGRTVGALIKTYAHHR